MGRCVIIIILAVVFSCPSELIAAEPERPLEITELFGIFTPEPGGWSEYVIFDKTSGRRAVIRMAIVGVDGDSYWYEAVNRGRGGSNIIKMLVKRDPYNTENILRIVTKSGVAAAQEISRDFMPLGRDMVKCMFEQWSGITPDTTVNLKNIKTGVGTAVVPAGTFDVSKQQIVDGAGRVYAEYRLSRDICPFGIVAYEAENSTMILTEHGTGAESFITGKPDIIKPSPGLLEQILRGMSSGMEQPQYPIPEQRNNIRQLQGMGTGYDSMK